MVDEANHFPAGLGPAAGALFFVVGFIALVGAMFVLSGTMDRWSGKAVRQVSNPQAPVTSPADEATLGLTPEALTPVAPAAE